MIHVLLSGLMLAWKITMSFIEDDCFPSHLMYEEAVTKLLLSHHENYKSA